MSTRKYYTVFKLGRKEEDRKQFLRHENYYVVKHSQTNPLFTDKNIHLPTFSLGFVTFVFENTSQQRTMKWNKIRK